MDVRNGGVEQSSKRVLPRLREMYAIHDFLVPFTLEGNPQSVGEKDKDDGDGER